MPEFRSRIDAYRWQTPAFSELFSMDSLPAPDEKAIEIIRRKLERKFMEADIDVSLFLDRVMPSYTCYLAESERKIDEQVVQNHIYQIEEEEGWIIGFDMESKQSFRIFLRSDTHHPLNWKHVVTRITFRKSETRTSFVIGVNLKQNTRVIDWMLTGNLLVVGSGGSKFSAIRNMLITALMLNTPSEFRFALIGHGSDEYRILRDAPHALGKGASTKPEQGTRLLLGIYREIQRRKAIYDRLDVDDFQTCNILLEDDNEAILPRIMLVLDTLHHVDWVKSQDKWLPHILDIVRDGATYGIHVVVTTNGLHLPYPFDEIADLIPNRLVTRSAALDTTFMDAVDNVHASTFRFIDSFLSYDNYIQPIELPAISAADIRSIVAYWQDNRTSRFDGINLLNINGDGDDTVRQLVRELINEQSNTAPPTPKKPSPEALARAAEVLAEDEEINKTQRLNISDQFSTNGFKPIESVQGVDLTLDTIHRAQALATYLGWLGKGPLMDILGLNLAESNAVIAILQARQILERGSNPTPHLHPKRRK